MFFTRLIFVVALGISCMASKCATNSTGPGGTVSDAAVVPGGFGHCSSQAIKDVANQIQGEIANALATGDYEAAIADLVAKYTVDEVECGLEIFIGGNARKASADALLASEISRAQAYLKAHP